MKSFPVGNLFLLAFLLVAPLAPRVEAQAIPEQAPVSFDYFYNALSPFGQWVQVESYGYCWHPNNVGPQWRPYADGYWAYTEDGWTWVSYEPFGWITYHYGRWVHLDNYGWCWTPDYQWAPAWVSWRSGEDYVGWAPLPPEAHFETDVGFDTTCDTVYDIGPTYYNFCPVRSFGSPGLLPVLVDPARNAFIIGNTANVTNVLYRDEAVINGGPDFRALSRRTDAPIQSLQLVRQTDPNAFAAGAGSAFAHRVGNQLVVAAPNVAPPAAGFKPANVSRVFTRQWVDRGWNSIADPNLKAQLRARFAREGPTAAGSRVEGPRAGAVQPQSAGVASGAQVVPATHSVTARARQQFVAPPPASAGARQAIVEPPPTIVRGNVVEEQRRAAQTQQTERLEQAQQVQQVQQAQRTQFQQTQQKAQFDRVQTGRSQAAQEVRQESRGGQGSVQPAARESVTGPPATTGTPQKQ